MKIHLLWAVTVFQCSMWRRWSNPGSLDSLSEALHHVGPLDSPGLKVLGPGQQHSLGQGQTEEQGLWSACSHMILHHDAMSYCTALQILDIMAKGNAWYRFNDQLVTISVAWQISHPLRFAGRLSHPGCVLSSIQALWRVMSCPLPGQLWTADRGRRK